MPSVTRPTTVVLFGRAELTDLLAIFSDFLQ